MTNKDQELPEGRPTDADFTDSTVSPDSPDAPDGTEPQDTTVSSEAEIPETTDTDNTGDATAVRPGHDVSRTIAGSTWVALIIGAVVLVLLLVFILQNGDSAELNVFFWTWNFPIGVGMLIAAVGGALVAASIGTVRIFQLRRQVKKGN
ncbi:MAG: lipopolysaccharide assembly protein LapA domain-containing protein [Corynebacterium variabile]|uniref:LapA family protein n=1 Tax=Corynebacterium variabile TaxID=1727 RepID=UPI002648C492|nr:lipopolysaccharide assembly protein LapA domain-containing protein [Corynebacterium variabile]MDN6661883.1 lipopolysaccharide assembly protein LapA domain-containing protein [Corynebacterium variabile]